MARAIDPNNVDDETRLATQFDHAWLADLHLIRELTQQEKQAEEDRAFAASLAGLTIDEIPDNVRRMAMLLDDFDDESDDENIQTDLPVTTHQVSGNNREPSQTIINTATTRSVVVVPKTATNRDESKPKKCAVCLEKVSRHDPRAPCGHTYHLGCLRDLFTAAMQDETLMPPRCCRQEIPLELVRPTPAHRMRFEAKRVEYSTTDRLYCSQPTCSTFIPPTHIVNSIGTCPKISCEVTTCAICKAASHGNLDCPKDEATLAVIEEALKAGWARCYRCRAMVELTQGCYHMTCRCRGEFCYLCAVPWKNCPCVQWDEARLVDEARIRVERNPLGRPQHANRIDDQQRVEVMVNQLRTNYECRHTRGWVYTRGGGRCEECSDYLPQYLYRCSGCQFMACNRCRRNRL